MKKILGLMVSAVLVMGLVGAGTFAFFTDPETSTGNILQAGTLDLNIAGGDADVKMIDTSVSNIYPGANATVSSTLANVGSIDGELDITFSSITNVGAVGGTSEFADDSGDIGSSVNVTISVYIDVDQSGSWNTGDIDLENDGTSNPFTNDGILNSGTIDSYGGTTWNNVYGGVDQFISLATDNFTVYWVVTTGAGNDIQGDSATWDMTFTLEQAGVDVD